MSESRFSVSFIQMGARVYIPSLGRFLSVDPVEGGTQNDYVYPVDPINSSDYSGRFLIALPVVVISLPSLASVATFIGTAISAVVIAVGIIATVKGVELVADAVQESNANKTEETVKQAETTQGTTNAGTGCNPLTNNCGKSPSSSGNISNKSSTQSPNYTKSSLTQGREIHSTYKADLVSETRIKEYNKIQGIRPDFVDLESRTIYELKPFNPRGIQRGTFQLEKYKSIFEDAYGGKWNVVLDLY